jgi:prepilin-type N-terminal cleavage/methylation domain-containing protein
MVSSVFLRVIRGKEFLLGIAWFPSRSFAYFAVNSLFVTFRGQHFSSHQGFTLVELLVGVTLSGMVMAAVLSSYIFLARSFTRLSNQQTLESEARRTLTYFSRDVQAATGLVVVSTSPTSPAANRVDFTVPAGTGTNTITYYYNSTSADAVVAVNGTNITMVANSLTRCVYNGSTVTPLLLLRSITDNDASTTSDLTIRYYDNSSNEYTAATLSAGSYLPSIKQLSLEFSTQTGVSLSGTRTLVYRVASARVLLHNNALLQ